MPEVISENSDNRDRFYESYVRTYLERDVRDLSGDIDVLKFHRFMVAVAAYLTRWNSVEALMNGAQNGAFLENFAISEIVKGYYNSGKTPFLNYFRDKDGKEIDLLWEENGTLYPLEIKKTANPNVRLTKVFRALESSGKILGNGGVVCLYDDLSAFDKDNFIIPMRGV